MIQKFISMNYSRFFHFFSLIPFLIGSSLYDSLPSSSYINVLLNNRLSIPSVIVVAVICKRLMRVILDAPVGMIVDKTIGPMASVQIGILLKILSFLMLFLEGPVAFFAYIIIDSISVVFFRGKINVLQYNVLSSIGEEESYAAFNAKYNICLYLFTAILGFVGNFIFVRFGINGVISISLLFLIVSFALVSGASRFLKKQSLEYVASEALSSGSIKSYKIDWRAVLNRRYVGFILLLGVCCVAWTLNVINQFFAVEISGELFASKVFIYGCVAMFFGAVASMHIKTKNVVLLSTIFCIILLVNIALPFIIPEKYVFVTMFLYFLFFNVYENVLRCIIMKNTPEHTRCSIASISSTLTSVISIAVIAIFQFTKSAVGLSFSYSAVFMFCAVFAFVGFACILSVKKPTKDGIK